MCAKISLNWGQKATGLRRRRHTTYGNIADSVKNASFIVNKSRRVDKHLSAHSKGHIIFITREPRHSNRGMEFILTRIKPFCI